MGPFLPWMTRCGTRLPLITQLCAYEMIPASWFMVAIDAGTMRFSLPSLTGSSVTRSEYGSWSRCAMISSASDG